MRKSILPITIFLLLVLSETICGAEIIDKIVAIVNGEIITLSELERHRSRLGHETDIAAHPWQKRARVFESRRVILDQLIEEKIVDQQCKKWAIKVSTKDIDAAIEDVKRMNAVTEEQLKMALMADGLSWEDYRKELTKQIQRAKLASQVVRQEFTVDDERLKRFYLQNIKRFKEPNQIRVSHILIVIPRDTDDLLVEALRHTGEMILDKLSRGEDFQALARLYSDDASAKNGGDLGFFKRGELLPQIERITFTLHPGQFRGLIRTNMGFHIIKVTDKKEGRVIPYEEVMEKVKNQYAQEESQRLYKTWLQTVKAKSFIEVKL